MNRIYITYLTFLITVFTYSQSEKKISDLENKKKQFEIKIENLTDSIKGLDLEIAQIKSKEFVDKIRDSSLTAMAKKGSKLKKKPNVFADIIVVFDEEKEVIILDYIDGYFEVCHNSLCGYINEIWLNKSPLISEFTQSRKTQEKSKNGLNSNSSNCSSSPKKTKKNA